MIIKRVDVQAGLNMRPTIRKFDPVDLVPFTSSVILARLGVTPFDIHHSYKGDKYESILILYRPN